MQRPRQSTADEQMAGALSVRINSKVWRPYAIDFSSRVVFSLSECDLESRRAPIVLEWGKACGDPHSAIVS